MDEFKQPTEQETPPPAAPAPEEAGAASPARTGCGGCCGGGGCCAQTQEPPTEEELHEAVDDALAKELLPASEGEPDAPAEPDKPQRVTVVDIHFRSGGKVYFFDPDGLDVKLGDHVIIDTARGAEYGICASGRHTVSVSDVVAPLRKVLRIATAQDEKTAEANREKEKKAYEVCQQKISEHKLDMQLVSAECAFDGSKLLFFFTADGRVDFRELVKNLASIFRTRIELRQIGVRDKAKMVGGLGVCGRPFCCSQFLDDFQPVSIKMAKTQNLSLNPTKISGTCGRLMCCLKYEQEAYEDLLKTAPKAESFVDTPDGRGTVCDVNLLRQSVKVRMEDAPETINSYQNSEIAILRNGKAKKTDPPIPKDLAPISGQPRSARKAAAPKEDADGLMPMMFRKLDAYTADSVKELPGQPAEGEQPGQQPRRRSRRRRKSTGPKPEAGQATAPKAEHSREQRPPKARSEQKAKESGAAKAPAESTQSAAGGEAKPRSRRRARSRRPKNPGAGQTPPAPQS